MQMTPNEAIILLRKWRDENRVVMCAMKTACGHSYVMGQITDITLGIVTINQAKSKLRSLGDAMSAIVSVNTADDCDYVEGRHVSPQFPKLAAYDALLTLTFGKPDNPSCILGFAVLPGWEESLKD